MKSISSWAASSRARRAVHPPARHIDDIAKHPRGMSRRCEAPKLAPRQGGIRFAQINQKGIQIWDIE